MNLKLAVFLVVSLFMLEEAVLQTTETPQLGVSHSAEKGLIKISIMYPYEEGKQFDMEYYESKHMPMVAGFLGSNLVNYTIEKGIASGIPNTPMPFVAIGTFYVKSLEDYQAAIGPNRDSIRADFANYTNISPVILVSEVVTYNSSLENPSGIN
ncbi:EthD family reductase [Algoriphagus sp. AGSA1]|uniref:EthD family reductase n=1 Tax=Algoriphagus sp. AGSA1 TaxID=2907213 RepID=UPI001F3B2577|nr:EthD family reductase [Algoriphagus sp. AGSA1]MCE7053874.1 EthD family reductase [Algoriphagus sp. AGSA1]